MESSFLVSVKYKYWFLCTIIYLVISVTPIYATEIEQIHTYDPFSGNVRIEPNHKYHLDCIEYTVNHQNENKSSKNEVNNENKALLDDNSTVTNTNSDYNNPTKITIGVIIFILLVAIYYQIRISYYNYLVKWYTARIQAADELFEEIQAGYRPQIQEGELSNYEGIDYFTQLTRNKYTAIGEFSNDIGNYIHERTQKVKEVYNDELKELQRNHKLEEIPCTLAWYRNTMLIIAFTLIIITLITIYKNKQR